MKISDGRRIMRHIFLVNKTIPISLHTDCIIITNSFNLNKEISKKIFLLNNSALLHGVFNIKWRFSFLMFKNILEIT